MASEAEDGCDLYRIRSLPRSDVVARLREALERAEAGEIRAVAIVEHFTHEGRQGPGCSYAVGDGSPTYLVGGLEVLKARLLREHLT